MTTTRRGRSGGHRLTRTLRRRRHFGREWIRVGMGWKTERELLRICSKIGRSRRRWRRSPSWSSTRVRAHPSSGRLTIRRLWRRCLLSPTIRLGDVVTVFSRTTSTATFSRQLGHIRTGRRCCPRLFSGWRVGQPFDLDGGNVDVERSVAAGTTIEVIACLAGLKFSHLLEDVLNDRSVIDGRFPLSIWRRRRRQSPSSSSSQSRFRRRRKGESLVGRSRFGEGMLLILMIGMILLLLIVMTMLLLVLAGR